MTRQYWHVDPGIYIETRIRPKIGSDARFLILIQSNANKSYPPCGRATTAMWSVKWMSNRRIIRIGGLDFLNPQFVDSLGKIGGLAALLILSLAFIYLLIINSKSNSKSSDNQTAIINQTAVMQASYNELFGRMVSMMGEMQVGARKRDEQINKINESFANGVAATNEQNKILNEQTVFLKQLKEETTSGHEFTKQLVASVVDGSKDTSAAVQNLDKRLSEGFKALPADVAHVLDDSFKAIRDDIAKLTDPDLATKVVDKLRPDVVAMFDKALAKCLEESVEVEKDKTDPLALVSLPTKLPSSGEDNRKALDAVAQEQPK